MKLLHRDFLVKFEKFLRTPILKHICERLHLCIDYSIYIDFYSLLKGYFQNLDPDPEKRGKRLDVEKWLEDHI